MSTWDRWVEAAKLLGRDPAAHVRCPVCDAADLEVRDVRLPGLGLLERYLVCPRCGARNILRMGA